MFKFFIKRIVFSLGIVLGVMLLTFGLFNVASGDPAGALLGKNATAEEVEALRRDLGADLPVFMGRFLASEAFSSMEFSRALQRSGVEIEHGVIADGVLALKPGSIGFTRNFRGEQPVFVRVEYRGELTDFTGVRHQAEKWDVLELEIPSAQERILFSSQDGEVREVIFGMKQANVFNSQFFRFLGEVVSFSKEYPYVKFFDFGKSITTREPIVEILKRGVVPSLCLMLPIFLGELIFGIVLALFATVFKDSSIDRAIVILSVGGMSISYLVVILFCQWFLGYFCNLFPVWGFGAVRHLYLPVLVGIVCGVGASVRFYRTVFVNELNREYLRTAAAKGCSCWSIYGKHLLKNAAIPIITRASSTLPFLFTGSLLLETFFGIPGLGYAGIDALNNSDLQLLKALVIFSAFLFVLLNLLADLAYAWVDPRIRLDD